MHADHRFPTVTRVPRSAPPTVAAWACRSVPIACAAIAVLLLTRGPAAAQDVTEPALKAAFIFNFAQFTEWPADVLPASEPVVLCVLGDPAVGDALVRTVKGRYLRGHSLAVRDVARARPERVCHVLYLSGVTAAQAAESIDGLRDVPVLTISDIERFTELGGIAQFSFEHGRLRFSVRFESVKRARLEISSRLLQLSQQK